MFKKLTLFFVNCVMLIGVAQAQLPPNDTAYQLVWSDEFSLDTIDQGKWMLKWPWNMSDSVIATCGTPPPLTDVGYRKWYRDSTSVPTDRPHDTTNYKLNNGVLTIVTDKVDYNGYCWRWPACNSSSEPQCNLSGCVNGVCWNGAYKKFKYTTGMLYSKYQFKYGYFELKFKIPDRNDLPFLVKYPSGPNFWLWAGGNEGDPNVPVPYSEIDIFEIDAYNGVYTSNIHYLHYPGLPSIQPEISQYHIAGEISGDVWHVAACNWTSDKIEYFLDGNLLYTMTNDSVRIDSLLPMAMIIDVNAPAVNFCRWYNPLFSAFPYNYDIDYVRVYQLKQGCSKTSKTFCSDFDPEAYGKMFKSVLVDGSSCIDAITNTHYTDILGVNYVTLDQGFSVDGNSTVLIDSQGCSMTYQQVIPAASQPPASWLQKQNLRYSSE